VPFFFVFVQILVFRSRTVQIRGAQMGAQKRLHPKIQKCKRGMTVGKLSKSCHNHRFLIKKVHQTTLSLLSMTLKTSHIFYFVFCPFFVCYGDRKQCPKSIDTVHLQTIALGDIITHMNSQIIMVSSRVSH
jgi:hypothetical protein